MRITRSQEEWQTIIEDQKNSGLTIIDYCQQQQLTISSFYAVRKKLSLLPGNFVRAKITQQAEFVEQQTAIIVTVG
jgi:putative transposase